MTTDTPSKSENYEVLQVLVQYRQRVAQKERIALGNRIDAIMRGDDVVTENTERVLRRLYEHFLRLEEISDNEIKDLVSPLPIVEIMTSVKGIGPMYAAQVVSMIDITRVDTCSAMWQWCGLGVTDGEADRRRKGQKITWNPTLKATILHKIGGSFLKASSPYRAIYDEWKAKYTRRSDAETDKDKKLTPWHIHNRARRKMVKRWVSHLWYVWRTIEGLPTASPYAHAILGHTDYEQPEQYGWKW